MNQYLLASKEKKKSVADLNEEGKLNQYQQSNYNKSLALNQDDCYLNFKNQKIDANVL